MAPTSPDTSYSVKEVAQLLGLGVGQIRRYARAGFVEPERGPRGELRFAFRDLAFLRIVKGLADARIQPQRVRRAIESARRRSASAGAHTDLRLDSAGSQVVVREEGGVWNAESGQYLLDFESGVTAPATVVSLPLRSDAIERASVAMQANDWYDLGRALEDEDPMRARDAYQRAIELDPEHGDAHLELGYLDHAAGKLQDAVRHYRIARIALPQDPTPHFNLGVALEDSGDAQGARESYFEALRIDSGYADAHYNLARLADCAGRATEVVQHLKAYRKLMGK